MITHRGLAQRHGAPHLVDFGMVNKLGRDLIRTYDLEKALGCSIFQDIERGGCAACHDFIADLHPASTESNRRLYVVVFAGKTIPLEGHYAIGNSYRADVGKVEHSNGK
jgi:hypothetical protein